VKAPRPISESIGDYLKAIYEFTEGTGRASTAALAKRLKIAPASVTEMLQKLASSRPAWVVYEKHRGASLTPAGRRRALELVRHHRLLESFLHESLGYAWDEVHAEAERLEHAISERMEDRIAERLGDPQTDPHGHPIPRKDGRMPKREDAPLAGKAAGSTLVVTTVPDADPQLLRRLGDMAIRPGAGISVLKNALEESHLEVRVGDQPGTVRLERSIAKEVTVLENRRETRSGAGPAS